MGFRQIGIDFDGSTREPVGLIEGPVTEKVAVHLVEPNGRVRIRHDGIGARVAGIDVQRALQEAPRLVKVAYRERSEPCGIRVRSLQVVVIGLPAAGWLGARALGLGHSYVRGKDRDDRAHHLILDGKDALKRAVVPLGPAMGTRRGIDQLRRNTNTVAPSAYATLKHVTHA